MDFKQLRYFLAVAEERSFGRAAVRLHMAQPPLSRQIRTLEDQEGVSLFVRTPYGVELTPAGQVLMEDAPGILRHVERARQRIHLADEGLAGRLDVGIFSSGELSSIPQMLRRFRAQRPEVEVSLHNMSKTEQLEALHERRIDIGFMRLVPSRPGISVEEVQREPLLVALPAVHPLLDREYLRLQDLDGEPILLYPKAELYGLAQEVTAAFMAEGVRLRVQQETDDIVTCITLVACGYGLCITTESAAYLQLPGVAYRPLRSERLPGIALTCAYRTDNESATLRAFLALVRSAAETSAI